MSAWARVSTAASSVARGRQRERLQRLDLDDAAGTALGGGRRVQPPQQRERRGGAVLGEQHPGQHQILRLPRVARVVIRAEAAFFHPAGGRSDLALGQQQPRPLRRDGVEQAGHSRARRHPPGLAHRLQRTSVVPWACRIHARAARPVASGWV